MLQNKSHEFRHIILKRINETVKQSKFPQEWKNSVINWIPRKKQE
jgi:hypothetical protein